LELRENIVCDVCGRRTTRKIVKNNSIFHVCLKCIKEYGRENDLKVYSWLKDRIKDIEKKKEAKL
jgi:ribosome-binding protein aMBF1 (putative translation factor)